MCEERNKQKHTTDIVGYITLPFNFTTCQSTSKHAQQSAMTLSLNHSILSECSDDSFVTDGSHGQIMLHMSDPNHTSSCPAQPDGPGEPRERRVNHALDSRCPALAAPPKLEAASRCNRD